ncbi:MAG TPA: DUF2171 domain-containing protein [Novosphingobium sp.]|nr:DUF2171 domain-containing protein [Novosphingobium sp.]
MTTPSTQSTDDETAWTTESGTIRKGMKVIAPDGTVLGIVAGVEGEEVLLAEHAGEHRPFVAISQIDGVNEDSVLLSDRGDATFGLGAEP